MDMLTLLEALQTEINEESTQSDSSRLVLMPSDNNNNTDAHTIEVDALGLRDRQVVAQALDMVVLFEVAPRLFPGVGVPVAQRSTSRPEAVDVLTRLQQQRCAPRISLQEENLGHITSRLVGILDSSVRSNAGDVAAVLAAKHTPDLLAALLQVAYAPIPPEGTPTDLRCYVECGAERRIELRRAFTRVFDNTSAYLLFESLTSLLNAAAVVASKKPLLSASGGGGGGPRWFRTLCGRFLSRVLMRPNGVRIAADFLVGNDTELTTDKLHRISSLLLTPPAGMPPNDYYRQVLPQVLRMAEIPRSGDLQSRAHKAKATNPDQSLVDNIMDTQAVNARIVQAAVYALRQLADKDRAAFSEYVAKPVIAPLMRCFDTRKSAKQQQSPGTAGDAGDAIGAALFGNPVRRPPLIEVISSSDTSRDQPQEQTPESLPVAVASSAMELAAALDGIQRLTLDGGVPSATMLADLIVPAFAPLLRWLSFESAFQGSSADTLREILAATLCHLPRSAAVTTVLNVVQTIFGPSDEEGDEGDDWPVFAHCREDSGRTCLAWKKSAMSSDGSEESAQQFVPVEALLDVLASDQVRSIIGDIFMTLLREQEALLDMLRSSDNTISDGLPRKWWLVSQTTVAMVDRLGPAVLAKHADVLAFVLNTMQRWVLQFAGSAPATNTADDVSIEELLKSLATKDKAGETRSDNADEKENEEGEAESVLGGTEMLLTALMLLGQMMESSQQSAFAALASSMDLGDTKPPTPVADPSMPAIEWDDDALRLLRRIYTQIKQISVQKTVPMVAKLASETKLQVALVLALHGETSSSEPTVVASDNDGVEVARFNAAVRDVRDDLVPVQAHGIIELRNMVLAKSPALLSAERMDAAIAIFTDMVRSPDSYIYLNAIRGLSSLADAHGRRFVPVLAEMYTSSSMSLEERLRVGEALLQSVQRAGPMLADYASDVVPRLLAAVHPNDVSSASSLLADEESSEPVVLVHSALSILSAVAQACPLALQKWIAEIASTLDGMLLLPDSAIAPVLRRAAVVFWVSLLRGYGDRLLRLVDAHTLRSAYRSLRRVGESDSDELTRLHALVGIEELDELMKDQLSSIRLREIRTQYCNIDSYKWSSSPKANRIARLLYS
ncbi:hypothetical protein GGF42_000104 [Coemansia sp. RSA 2424]|nr:hypothetical protein GGF42_000104 [Coemansia sp. RSA 2424]